MAEDKIETHEGRLYSLVMRDGSLWQGYAAIPIDAWTRAEKETGKTASYFVFAPPE